MMEFGKAVSAILSLFRGVACWGKNVQEADSMGMKVAKNYIISYYIDSGTNQKLQSNVLLHIMILN